MDAGVGGERLQRVGGRGGQEDRGELDGVEARAPRQAGLLEESEVESDVVPGDGRLTDEGGETRDRLRQRRRADKIGVADAGQARDRGADRNAGVDERRETFADGDAALDTEDAARRADLDNAVGRRIESGRLDVERDELQLYLLLGPERQVPRGPAGRNGCCRSSDGARSPKDLASSGLKGRCRE
jgi:hypothetical protein